MAVIVADELGVPFERVLSTASDTSKVPNANREDNVHGSKAVGKPPFMLAISVFEALRNAVAQAGGEPEAMNAPATAEDVLRAEGD